MDEQQPAPQEQPAAAEEQQAATRPPTASGQRSLRERLRVPHGGPLDLSAWDPRETYGHAKADAKKELALGVERLADLQERLWASRARSVLIVLQGMDTAGKDGTIKHVMGGFNPIGVQVVPFGVPSAEELGHDYLWRVHKVTPAKGNIAIFNRSHYEDVLVVRVESLVSHEQWSRRYGQIQGFESHLAANGTVILKFFLHISHEEQRARLQARVDSPDKRWKFKLADLEVRKRWDDYQMAYQDALSRTSTDEAPWYVIPADRKWFRNLAVADILSDTLDDLVLEYPAGEAGLEGLVVV
jgi:PPK2 family polyphosphate:nucleotide phosphotransferase